MFSNSTYTCFCRLLDAHIYFVHDKAIEKRENAHYIQCEKLPNDEQSNPHGFQFKSYMPLKETKVKDIQLRFIPPCMINNNITFTNVRKKQQSIYLTKANNTQHQQGYRMDELIIIIPIDKKRSRAINIFYRNFMKFGQSLNSHEWVERMFTNMSNKILQQDLGVIASVQENLALRAKPYQYTVVSDMPIMEYRKFIEAAEKKQDPWFKGFTAETTDIEDLVK